MINNEEFETCQRKANSLTKLQAHKFFSPPKYLYKSANSSKQNPDAISGGPMDNIFSTSFSIHEEKHQLQTLFQLNDSRDYIVAGKCIRRKSFDDDKKNAFIKKIDSLYPTTKISQIEKIKIEIQMEKERIEFEKQMAEKQALILQTKRKTKIIKTRKSFIYNYINGIQQQPQTTAQNGSNGNSVETSPKNASKQSQKLQQQSSIVDDFFHQSQAAAQPGSPCSPNQPSSPLSAKNYQHKQRKNHQKQLADYKDAKKLNTQNSSPPRRQDYALSGAMSQRFCLANADDSSLILNQSSCSVKKRECSQPCLPTSEYFGKSIKLSPLFNINGQSQILEQNCNGEGVDCTTSKVAQQSTNILQQISNERKLQLKKFALEHAIILNNNQKKIISNRQYKSKSVTSKLEELSPSFAQTQYQGTDEWQFVQTTRGNNKNGQAFYRISKKKVQHQSPPEKHETRSETHCQQITQPSQKPKAQQKIDDKFSPVSDRGGCGAYFNLNLQKVLDENQNLKERIYRGTFLPTKPKTQSKAQIIQNLLQLPEVTITKGSINTKGNDNTSIQNNQRVHKNNSFGSINNVYIKKPHNIYQFQQNYTQQKFYSKVQ